MTFDELKIFSSEIAPKHLRKEFIYSFQKVWWIFGNWLEKKGIREFFRPETREFLDYMVTDHYASLIGCAVREKRIVQAMCVLDRYIRFRKFYDEEKFDVKKYIKGSLGEFFNIYIQRRAMDGLSLSSIEDYTKICGLFFRYVELTSKKLSDFISTDFVNFFSSLKWSNETIYAGKCRLRIFLFAAYKEGILSQNISFYIPKQKIIHDKTITTTFSSEEIRTILNVIDRHDANGKRDYAMILTIVAHGWRAGDVCNLKLSAINWRTKEINFIQQKTKVAVRTTLADPVFYAIVDYVRFGRPESDKNEIFLSTGKDGTIKEFAPGNISQRFREYLKKAGIKNLFQRKTGVHSLRFSLATNLINQGTPISTVKTILGHKNPEVTLNYVRLDLEGLRKCVLPMPYCNSPCYKEEEESSL